MKKFITIICTMFLAMAVYSQSVDATTQILETDEVTYGQVCYLAAAQQGLIGDNTSYSDAFEMLKSKGQVPKSDKFGESDLIPIVNIAYVLSQTFDVNGGVMYHLTKGSPRYAFKQLKSDRVIGANVSPGKYISGLTLFNIFTNCLDTYTDFDINAVSMENE